MRSLFSVAGVRARRSAWQPLLAALVVLSPAPGAQARAQSSSSTGSTSVRPAPGRGASRADSTFAALQARGADGRGMGVDQYTSSHQFDAFPDGGRIELQRTVDDTTGITAIRHHLRDIAAAFGVGDFQTPIFVHMQQVPG